jgi:PhzF family phenazine biosynthesis protein
MELVIYQVDAFTEEVFGGNPAAICPLQNWLSEEVMQKIAEENNISETAFFVKKDKIFEIRWFMPYAEIDLCGHATLASAFIIFTKLYPTLNEIVFSSKSGILKATKDKDGLISLDFPSRPPKQIEIPKEVFSAFEKPPLEAYISRDLILLYDDEEDIKNANPQLHFLKDLPYLCIVPTSKSKKKEIDFVSRVFDANGTLPEDPVTGSAHASLIPFWKEKLNKTTFKAIQLSERKGTLFCAIHNDRVKISGKAVLYLQGTIFI